MPVGHETDEAFASGSCVVRPNNGMTLDTITPHDLETLVTLEGRDAPAISMYVPLEPSVDRDDATRIRLKNLLRSAERQLELSGGPRRSLRRLQQLLLGLGRPPSDATALAAFVADGYARCFLVPEHVEPMAVVGSRPWVRPLLPLWQDNGTYYILALSQQSVRLLKADRYDVEEVEVAGLALELLTAPRGADDDETAREKLLRALAHRVDPLLAPTRAPLVLACVDYLHPLYRAVSDYDDLCSEFVPGNPDARSEDELRSRAWHIVAPRFAHDTQHALAQYWMRRRAGMTITGLHDVLRAARVGRVATLFIRDSDPVWGEFDPAVGAHRSADGSEDLLGRAAILTLASSGRVYHVDPKQMPTPGPVTATVRYLHHGTA